MIEGELASDENAPFLGEVALVDGTSRVGQTGRVFYETLFDENASCHVAYGSAYAEAVEGGVIDGVNVSSVHTDFMIGGAGRRGRRGAARRDGRRAAARQRLAAGALRRCQTPFGV